MRLRGICVATSGWVTLSIARGYYSPAFQRFISEDQIRFWGGMNLYAYSGADPVNNIDPDGLFTAHRVITREAGRAAGLSPADAKRWPAQLPMWILDPVHRPSTRLQQTCTR